jgi:Flp pilus assembly protein CpaB
VKAAFDRRTVGGAVLAVAAALLVLIATRPPATTPVLVAAAALGPGVPLDAGSLAIRDTTDPAGMVTAGSADEYAGWVLTAPLDAGEPIPASQLHPPERIDHPDVVGLALAEEHAVLGDLRPGDRVDVYLTSPGTDGDPPSTLVAARGVLVVAVAPDPDGFGADRLARLLVAADDDLASLLVNAARTGSLDLVRLGR